MCIITGKVSNLLLLLFFLSWFHWSLENWSVGKPPYRILNRFYQLLWAKLGQIKLENLSLIILLLLVIFLKFYRPIRFFRTSLKAVLFFGCQQSFLDSHSQKYLYICLLIYILFIRYFQCLLVTAFRIERWKWQKSCWIILAVYQVNIKCFAYRDKPSTLLQKRESLYLRRNLTPGLDISVLARYQWIISYVLKLFSFLLPQAIRNDNISISQLRNIQNLLDFMLTKNFIICYENYKFRELSGGQKFGPSTEFNLSFQHLHKHNSSNNYS